MCISLVSSRERGERRKREREGREGREGERGERGEEREWCSLNHAPVYVYVCVYLCVSVQDDDGVF